MRLFISKEHQCSPQFFIVVLVDRSCLTLCDPVDCSLPGSSVHGIFPGKNTGWSGLPFPSPGHLPHPGIEPESLTLQAVSLSIDLPGKPT